MPESYCRCKYRYNRLLNWKVGQHKRHGFLFKLLHANPEYSELFQSPLLSVDLVPFMTYSLDKQRRWEIQIDQNCLEVLQKINNNLEVMVFERVAIRSFVDDWRLFSPHYITSLYCSKIKKGYEISKDGVYKEEQFGGVGRYYGFSTKKLRQPPTTMEIVTYHTVQEPKNWKKVYTQRYRKWKWDRHNDTYIRKSAFDPKSLKFEVEILDQDFYELEDYEDFENEAEILATPTLKFYNLMDHLATKQRRRTTTHSDFLFVN